MKYNNPQDMAMVGVKTPQAVIYKSESHKLHQAFVVKNDETIIQGQPVMLNADGTISPYVGGEGVYLGIAMTDSVYPAYPGNEVTVMVEGFAVVYGLSRNNVDAGYVDPEALSEGDMYVHYATSEEETHFIALNKATEGDDLIQVLVR